MAVVGMDAPLSSSHGTPDRQPLLLSACFWWRCCHRSQVLTHPALMLCLVKGARDLCWSQTCFEYFRVNWSGSYIGQPHPPANPFPLPLRLFKREPRNPNFREREGEKRKTGCNCFSPFSLLVSQVCSSRKCVCTSTAADQALLCGFDDGLR
jgi:hypothetical protein